MALNCDEFDDQGAVMGCVTLSCDAFNGQGADMGCVALNCDAFNGQGAVMGCVATNCVEFNDQGAAVIDCVASIRRSLIRVFASSGSRYCAARAPGTFLSLIRCTPVPPSKS